MRCIKCGKKIDSEDYRYTLFVDAVICWDCMDRDRHLGVVEGDKE